MYQSLEQSDIIGVRQLFYIALIMAMLSLYQIDIRLIMVVLLYSISGQQQLRVTCTVRLK